MSILAAPILVKREIVGTISIACPTGRLQNDEYRRTRIRSVAETADEVSLNYRYLRPSGRVRLAAPPRQGRTSGAG